MRPLTANGKREDDLRRFDDSGGARCARVGLELASVIDLLLASRQNESPEVAQPWRRECPPFRGLQGTFWNSSGRVRTSRFTAADSTATRRQSWRFHSPQNSRRLTVSGGSSTSTRSRPNSIPRGRPSLWPLLVTKGGQSSYSRIPAVSPWI